MAISGLIADLPLTMLSRAWRETPRTFATALTATRYLIGDLFDQFAGRPVDLSVDLCHSHEPFQCPSFFKHPLTEQMSCGLQPLQLQAVGADVGKIVLSLLDKPAFSATAEDLR
jgi:hypothetical protein